jgi:hypothetical protein
MAAPRPPLLALEAFEDRTLPSGGAFHHDRPSAPSGEWSPTPAHMRFTDDGPRADRNAPESRSNSQFFALAQMLALMAASARESAPVAPDPVSRAVQATTPSSLAPPDAEPEAAQPPQNSPESPAPDRAAPDRTPFPGPGAPGAVPLAVPLIAGQPTAGHFKYDAPEPIEAAPTNPRSVEPIVIAPVVTAPHPRTTAPFADWFPVVDLPPAAPLAGLLGFDGAGVEEEIRRLLELTAGIGVDDAHGSEWYLWLAAGAALAGGAGYAVWSNQTGRPNRAPRTGTQSWEVRDDAGVR